MSKFSDQLQPASFRGIPFEVTASGLKIGRRTVVHEYPQKDQPFVEDLGRATRQITITAFVIGDDYIAQAQSLMAELEAPGSGTFIHPWLGEMEVTITSISELKFDAALGVASVVITATEAGILEFPTISVDAESEAFDVADAVEESAIDRFVTSIDLKTINKYIDSALQGDILDCLGIISNSELSKIFDFAEGVAETASKAMSLLSTDPKIFATKLAGALGLSRWATTVSAWRGVAKQLENLVGHDKLSSGTKAYRKVVEEGTTLSDVQKTVMKNRAAVETLTRQLLIAQMVGVSALVGSDKDSSAPGTTLPTRDDLSEMTVHVRSYDELIETRTVLTEALDTELLLETNDEMYKKIEDARVAVFEVLTSRADLQQRLITVTPTDVVPAVVLAYDYHDDATRDSEIALRNGVRHEGFCPASPLRILSE